MYKYWGGVSAGDGWVWGGSLGPRGEYLLLFSDNHHWMMFFILVQKYSIWSVLCRNIQNYGVLCRNIGQVQYGCNVNWTKKTKMLS